jgi:hypothetical protein
MNSQSFIFIHDQEIVIDYIKINKFKQLENVNYIFLGNKDVSKIKDLPNVIICRELPYNIEEFPKLTSFTGWYAIWKNKLFNKDLINLFEYDINLHKNFTRIVNEQITKTPTSTVVGYIPFSPHHYNFIGHKIWISELEDSIYKNYNIKISEFLKKLPENFICSMTSNHTMDKLSFDKYMEWMSPMIDDIKMSNFSGHLTERSISLFYILNNINNLVIPNVLEHFQFDSHGTQNIPKEKLINNYKYLLNNEL